MLVRVCNPSADGVEGTEKQGFQSQFNKPSQSSSEIKAPEEALSQRRKWRAIKTAGAHTCTNTNTNIHTNAHIHTERKRETQIHTHTKKCKINVVKFTLTLYLLIILILLK